MRGRFLTGVMNPGKVWVMGSSICVEPGEGGRYEIKLPEGGYKLMFYAEGIGEKAVDVVVEKGKGANVEEDVRMGRVLAMMGFNDRAILVDLETGDERPLIRDDLSKCSIGGRLSHFDAKMYTTSPQWGDQL